MKVYTVRCVMLGDELPAKVLMPPGDELTVTAYGEVIYKHVFTEMCEIEFDYMEVREK